MNQSARHIAGTSCKDSEDYLRFGYLQSTGDAFVETVNRIEGTHHPQSGCTFLKDLIAASSQSSNTLLLDEHICYLIRPVVYQATCGSTGILTSIATAGNAAVSYLRRKVTAFSVLPPNWDAEGAEAVSATTITTARQIIERIAIVLERIKASTAPSVMAFPDGSIFFKWIQGQKELTLTALGTEIEVQRWEPLDAYHSLGLWNVTIDDVLENVEWVLT
jgi:hypothetical protein